MQCKNLSQVSVSGSQIAAVQSFLDWLRNQMPDVYAEISAARPDLLNADSAAQGLSGVYGHSVTPSIVPSNLRAQLKSNSLLHGLSRFSQAAPSTDASTPSTSWGTSLVNLAGGIITAIDQQKLFNTQVARAEAGLPPLDVSAAGVPVNVGLSSSTQQLVMWGLIGTGVYFAAKMLMR